MMPLDIHFTVEYGDIASFEADVVVLKYAQAFFGADKYVASRLRPEGANAHELRPPVGEYRLVETNGAIAAKYALFIGVPTLREFRYEQIREFATRALDIVAKELPDTQNVAMTAHGAGTGLDEIEAFGAQLKGCTEALQAGHGPAQLNRISIVELVEDRARRFEQVLDKYLLNADYAAPMPEHKEKSPVTINKDTAKKARSSIVAAPTAEKPHAFIAMPFSDDMEDVFYYGIQNSVHANGILCERVDKSAFTGDIMGYVQQRIETACVVIAELTGANPNVYLEVGYAWGKERPTILLVQSEKELEFDVRGHKCLTYRKIKDLEQSLNNELKGMVTKGIIKLQGARGPA